jgi:hypothetical protein
MVKTLLLVCVFVSAAAAQPLGAGLKLGVPASDAYKLLPIPTFSPLNAKGQQFTFGPYIELRLPANNSIEVDALHKTHNFVGASASQSVSSWDFPIVWKHKIGSHLIKPYFEGGVNFSRLSDVVVLNLSNRSNFGLVVGGGVEINMLLLKISPEIRYTGYALRTLDEPNVQSKRNQVAILLGIGF